MRLRCHWHFNSESVEHATVLTIDGYTGEAVILERIATAAGDRALAQYIVISRVERI